MISSDEKTVVLEVTFAKRTFVQPILDRLLEAGLRSATVLRGRVTSSDSWYQLELKGSIQALHGAVREEQRDSISFSRFVPILA